MVPGATGYLPDEIVDYLLPDPQRLRMFDRDPAAATDDLLAYCQGRVAGLLILVTDDSFLPDQGPFFVEAENLAEFARGYPDVVDRAFLSGDTIIVSPSNGNVIILHHSEVISTIHGTPYAW